MALAGRGCCQERQHAGTGSDRALCFAGYKGYLAGALVERYGFKHDGECGSLRWLHVPTSSVETVGLALVQLCTYACWQTSTLARFDIFGEGSCLHAPYTTASAIPGASLYLACSFCSRGFEQQGNVHAATVIED